ncbi:MAG: hypothetical protein WCI71_07480 [Bacteroidota bacterium]
MNDLGKANEVLVKELQELRKEHDALRALYEKDTNKCRKAEEVIKHMIFFVDNGHPLGGRCLRSP